MVQWRRFLQLRAVRETLSDLRDSLGRAVVIMLLRLRFGSRGGRCVRANVTRSRTRPRAVVLTLLLRWLLRLLLRRLLRLLLRMLC